VFEVEDLCRHNAYDRAIFARLSKLHLTIGKCENGKITPESDIVTRVELSTTLTDDNIPGTRNLTAEKLHSKPFTVTIASVF
jgi:hypothetical protein